MGEGFLKDLRVDMNISHIGIITIFLIIIAVVFAGLPILLASITFGYNPQITSNYIQKTTT